MIKKPDYTSNKINSRQIYGTPWHYSGSTIENLNLGQHEVIRTGFVNSDAVPAANRIMPNICDEHVWAQFQAGSNSQSGGTALADPSFSAKAKSDLIVSVNGEFESNDTGWTTTNMAKIWFPEAEGSVGGYEACSIVTSSANQTLHSPTFTTSMSLIGQDYYVYSRLRVQETTLTSINDKYVIRVTNGGIGTQFQQDITDLLKKNVGTGSWTEFHGRFTSTVNSSSIKIEIYKTGTNDQGFLLVDALEVYKIGDNQVFEVNSNIYTLGTGVVGGYYAFCKTSDATLKAAPWEANQEEVFSTKELWSSWWIGRIYAAGTGGSGHQLSVQVGVVPDRGDWIKHFPKDGYSAMTLGTGELVNVYELAWWLRKSGLYMVQITNGDIVCNMNQYDSIPGSDYQVVPQITGQAYGEYQLQNANHAFNDGQLSAGSELFGKIKGIRAGLHINPSTSSGSITAYVAPDER